MKCKQCKSVEIEGKNRLYCSEKCRRRTYYLKNRDREIARTRKWEKENPERKKESNKKGLAKFRKNKPERFNELMMKCYHRNKKKWSSRKRTKDIINSKIKITSIKHECECGSKENLSLKFMVYPTKAKAIRKAIDNKKIFYICKRCRYG